jgi:hypothetical protein
MDQKKCSRCNIVKPLDDYHNRSVSRDGYDNACKVCRKQVAKRDARLTDYKDNIHNYDRIGKHTEEILEALGYELYNDDYPVHKQFEDRMATKYKNK